MQILSNAMGSAEPIKPMLSVAQRCKTFPIFQEDVDFCVLCVLKTEDNDCEPIVNKVKEVNVNFVCEANWMEFGKGRRSRCDQDEEKIIDVCETTCS